MVKPVAIITTGDPVGIGPEVILKGLHSLFKQEVEFYPLIIGSSSTYTRHEYQDNFTSLDLDILNQDQEIPDHMDKPLLIDIPYPGEVCLPGEGSEFSGRAAGMYLDKAVHLLMNGIGDFLVTAPLNKYYFQMGGYNYKGHTDYLQDRTGSAEAYMTFASSDFNLILLTHHIPILEVPSFVTAENINKLLRFIVEVGPRYGIYDDRTRVAITGLNPHAGEDGRIGSEEIEHIIPAVEKAKSKGMNISGPLPADALFRPEVRAGYDLLVAMYHDQGLAGIKALGSSVNVTVGLPFIRTSVDHGTAFDIAGKGIADPSSFEMAVHVGLNMLKKSKNIF
jgi:4-hydroxythreonine-4-phosphate dehydrogenase